MYRHLGETLQLLWNAEVHNNTVHVTDVCRAIWHLCVSDNVKSGDVFNITDGSDTTFGDLAEIIASIFEIKYKFLGKMLSTLAKVLLNPVLRYFILIFYYITARLEGNCRGCK